MRSFIDISGENIMITLTHESYAEKVKGLCLGVMLECYVRVHIHAKHMVLETNQSHITRVQKIRAGKLYKEHGCIGWTIQIDGEYKTSDMHECTCKINWNKLN